MYIKCFILLANMKIIQSFFLFLLFSIVYGCSNGTDVSSLCFEKEYYEKPLLENPSENLFGGTNTHGLAGGSIGYCYNSIIGPIEAELNYSNQSKKLGYYIGVGFTF